MKKMTNAVKAYLVNMKEAFFVTACGLTGDVNGVIAIRELQNER